MHTGGSGGGGGSSSAAAGSGRALTGGAAGANTPSGGGVGRGFLSGRHSTNGVVVSYKLGHVLLFYEQTIGALFGADAAFRKTLLGSALLFCELKVGKRSHSRSSCDVQIV
jgi:hypothetical protein